MKLTKGSRVRMRDIIDDMGRPWPDDCVAREYVQEDAEAGTVVGVEGTGCALVVWDGFADEAGNEDEDGIPYLPTWRLPVWALELVEVSDG